VLLINNFINPPSKEIVEDDTNLTKVLVKQYSVTQEIEPEEEEETIKKVTLAEARRALKALQLYKLQCPNGRKDIILKLESIKTALNQRQSARAKQQGIMTFFSRLEGGVLETVCLNNT
jgi:hypothetical protein